MCYVYPQINYGQGKNNAYNPANRGAVYQQVQRATKDANFARNFATDIIFGQPGTGDFDSTEYWTWQSQTTGNKDDSKTETWFGKTTTPDSYLYNRNSLNASKSWVAQAFGNPALQGGDGNWYRAQSIVDNRNASGTTQYGFRAGERITDAQTVRMLNEGHYAFKAGGYDGSEVYVPWAQGYTPAKGQGGRPEAENSKSQTSANATPQRDMVSPSTAQPNNVIAGQASLLGNDRNKKTLLG